MDTRDTVLHLLESLYAAPGSLEGWRAFLLELCTAVDGTSASFISHNLHSKEANISLIAKCDPVVIQEYAEHWGELDPWVHSPKAASLSTGFVATGAELIGGPELQRTPYYNDFARRYEITQALAGMVDVGPHGLSFLSINRGDLQPTFGRDEVSVLRVLMPHLQRALHIHQRIAVADGVGRQSMDALDRLGHGALFCDRRGRVETANHEAERILAMRDGLIVERGELRASRPRETEQLHTFLADGLKTNRAEGVGAGGVMHVGRPSGRRPLHVVIAPMPSSTLSLTLESPAVMLLVTDPERRPLPSHETIQQEFALTPAEAKLAHALLNGNTVQQAAVRLNITVNTARTRLKSVFEKTRTHRQVELIRLLLK